MPTRQVVSSSDEDDPDDVDFAIDTDKPGTSRLKRPKRPSSRRNRPPSPSPHASSFQEEFPPSDESRQPEPCNTASLPAPRAEAPIDLERDDHYPENDRHSKRASNVGSAPDVVELRSPSPPQQASPPQPQPPAPPQDAPPNKRPRKLALRARANFLSDSEPENDSEPDHSSDDDFKPDTSKKRSRNDDDPTVQIDIDNDDDDDDDDDSENELDDADEEFEPVPKKKTPSKPRKSPAKRQRAVQTNPSPTVQKAAPILRRVAQKQAVPKERTPQAAAGASKKRLGARLPIKSSALTVPGAGSVTSRTPKSKVASSGVFRSGLSRKASVPPLHSYLQRGKGETDK